MSRGLLMPKICSRPVGFVDLPNGISDDLDTLEKLAFTKDYSRYAVGRWDTLPLFNRDGDLHSSISYEYLSQGKWTTNAAVLPQIVELIEKVFRTDLMRSARIFVAEGAGLIRLHRDYLEFKFGFTRVHLVLKTNPKAMNGERNHAFHMTRGSIWYLEGREPHWAVNGAIEPRYHLVCDFPPNLEPEQCLLDITPIDVNDIAWCPRPTLPLEVDLLLKIAILNINSDNIEKLFDIADIVFVKYDLSAPDPYEFLLGFLSNTEGLIDVITQRRKLFLGDL
jgi:hypothetical protein